ncbi:MAG: AhpC/TSA family protein [Nocardioidaceae bacterium]
MHEQRDNPAVGLVLIGFSPPERLAALARHLRWPGLVLSDPIRKLYAALGFSRAPLWRVYSPSTLLTYARAVKRGQQLSRPVEDTRQLGGDAVLVDGTVVALWRPRTPDDRPAAAEVLAAAHEQLHKHPPHE